VLADRAVATFVRSIIALGLEKFPDLKEYGGGTPALAYVRRRWGGEVAAVEYLLATKALLETKGATAPAMTTTVGWAQELANIIPIFLPILTALSAGVPLLAKGFQLSFDRAAAISLPLISTSAAKFVGQGQAIPVVDFSVVPGKKLEPFKLASVCVLTFEMLASSNAEQIVRQALAESIAKGLDAVLFGVGDATADQPAGLLFGTPALTKSAATTKTDAMIDDISALAGAVARVAGSGEVVFVTAPEQAASIRLRFPKDIGYAVLPTSSLATGTVIAIAARALASAFGSGISIRVDREGSTVMNDQPGELVDIGGVMARPVGSRFQTDTIGFLIKSPANWCLRAPGGVAWISGATW
jgi:hypothetical protein